MSDIITVFSNIAACFRHPKDNSEKAEIKHLAFESVPAWVQDSATFKALDAAGEIKVISSATDEATIAKNNGKIKKPKEESIDEDKAETIA